MICNKCKRDHTKKSEGPLTVCEVAAYFRVGTEVSNADGKKVGRGFGSGIRFQFPGAR